MLLIILVLICVMAAVHIIRKMKFSVKNPESNLLETGFYCGHQLSLPLSTKTVGFQSLTRHSVGCGLILWYFTLLLPVNIENKVTVFEMLFYHGVLLVHLLLLMELRESRQSSMVNLKDASVRDGSASTSHRIPLSDRSLSFNPCNQLQDRYCVLLDCLIDSHNRPRYIAWLLIHLFFVYYTTNLALTSVCTPSMYLDWFILPHDCSSVYDDFGRAWVFVAALYGLLGSILFVSLLLYELFLLVNKSVLTNTRSDRPCALWIL